MGHSSIRVTADTYGHLFPDANRSVLDNLDGITATGSCLIEAASTGSAPPSVDALSLQVATGDQQRVF